MISRSRLGKRARLMTAACLFALAGPSVWAGETSMDGLWKGPWYLGMSSGTAELRISTVGESLSGTLQLTNSETFGTDAHPLRNVSLVNGTFQFRVSGEDGQVMVGEVPVDLAKGVLKGSARYGGYKLRLELLRTP